MQENTTTTEGTSFKKKPMKFSSLQKFLLFENVGTERNESFVLGVTVVNETKIRFNVSYRAKQLNVGFSFYLIDFIPWLRETASILRKSDSIPDRSFSSGMPEAYMQPGKANHMSLTVSSDDKGPYLETLFKGVDPMIKVVRFRFNPIPGIAMMQEGKIIEQRAKVRMIAYLEQLARTIETVSAYISAINANEWTPPEKGDMLSS